MGKEICLIFALSITKKTHRRKSRAAIKKTGMQNCLKVKNSFNAPVAVVELKNDANKDSRSQ